MMTMMMNGSHSSPSKTVKRVTPSRGFESLPLRQMQAKRGPGSPVGEVGIAASAGDLQT
jgi:hypothetical protein